MIRDENLRSVNHAGPVDVADFVEAEGEEREIILRDAYEQVQTLLLKI